MKFLIHGNSPTARTGYGVQCGYLAEHLKKAGHDVAVSNTWGVQGSIQSWHGITIYPQGIDYQGNDILHRHAGHFFGGADPQECFIVTLTDVWSLTTPMLHDFNVLAWVPIDHVPPPPEVLRFLAENDAVPLPMSQFGFGQLEQKGFDPVYMPLTVDTSVFKPTATIERGVTGRELLGIPDDKFVVGMVAMNKGWAKDRKGFNEAFWAFGQFVVDHPDAVLYMHTEQLGGAEGINLKELAVHAGISDKNLVWADQYVYWCGGYTPEMMAAIYSAMDVLLAPSHGEGFCVPLIEAQACGTPVIATRFSSQAELIGPGWGVDGQPDWDPPHHAAYATPYVFHIIECLEAAYNLPAAEKTQRGEMAVAFAAQFDTHAVFEKHWLPFLETLQPAEVETKDPMPPDGAVAVLCPVLNRPENVDPLVYSFLSNTRSGEATLHFVAQSDDRHELAAIERHIVPDPRIALTVARDATTFAEKLNVGVNATEEPWVLCIGDDVRFHEGWLDEARALSDRYDVIGTNDSADGTTGNPRVKSGAHADHFFVRRDYIEQQGACLDGPGILAPEAYRHWYVDMEIVGLAKARGVFTPCLGSIVEHLHPGYQGREDLRQADSTYMLAVAHKDEDQATWMERLPLVEQQRVSRVKAR